jgi:predicted flap endonuclease-1-like 5' DNA nuclease
VAWSLGHSLLSVLIFLLGVAIGWLARDRRQRTLGAKVPGSDPTAQRPQLTPPAPATVTPKDLPTAASGSAPASKLDATAGAAGEPAELSATLSVEANTRTSAPTPPSSATALDEQPADAADKTAATQAANEPGGVPAVGQPSVPTADADHAPPDSIHVPAQSQSQPVQAVEDAGSAQQQTTDRPVADPADVATANPAPTNAPPATTTLTGDTDGLTSAITVEVDARGSTDDLRRIQGIGPKAANALAAAGIRSLQHLADTDEETLREAMRQAGVRGASTLSTWPQQARALEHERC